MAALGFWFSNTIGAAPPVVTAPVEGLRDASPRVHALVGARVVTTPGHQIERGTVVVRDGVIEAVGANVAVPADARVWDVTGRTVFAGFIESQSELFLPAGLKTPPPPEPDDAPQGAKPSGPEPAAGAHAWSALVTPERSVAEKLVTDAKGTEALRGLGFTVAHIVPARGIFRGQTALVSLGDGDFRGRVVRAGVTQALAFESGGPGEPAFPTSLMGSIALVRQTLSDAGWYQRAQAAYARNRNAERPETNASLAALEPVAAAQQPVLFFATDELEPLRAQRFAEEFKVKLILRASGDEYRVVRALDPRVPAIVPLTFPEVPEVEAPGQALDYPLDELENWELAPTNPAKLTEAGVSIALTSAGLKKPEAEFWPRVRQAVKRGLAPEAALAALTTAPASMLGVEAAFGTIEAGKVANLVVASGDLFASDDAAVQLVWIDGAPFELAAWRQIDLRGAWEASWSGAVGPKEFKIAGSAAKPKVSATGKENEVALAMADDALTLLAPGEWFGLEKQLVRLTARVTRDAIDGTGVLPDGRLLAWKAQRTGPPEIAKDDKAGAKEPAAAAASVVTGGRYPAGAFGRAALPERPAAVLVKNATVWTSGPQGVLEHADLLVENGKISRLGAGLAAPAGATVIDATGKFVSPGVIDPHSHIAIAGDVNEAGQSVTCEVRIGDVLDPTDINLYRQLAGGVTTANLLHGSANAIGGQSQVIKLRWGGLPEELKFEGAKPGVKFALGENVKQANWGDRFVTRYPQTRMGVREIIDDTFTRAHDYERAWAAFKAGTAPQPRRDFELDAALEILRGERMINIHSYRQDEVLMFVRLAQKWKLPGVLFQHILEGYKVADEIASIGAGGSCFSDWWAYKMEVRDAIPYDGALMRAAGVLVSFNSDDAELARRLNTEAAKAVKYGGVPPEEAFKFVTYNPAKQLHIDTRVGSLEPGKDADFVIWSAAPLSTFARAEQTWIDGRCYFSLADDARLRAEAAAERAALEQKILPERQKALGGGEGAPPPAPPVAAPSKRLYGDGRHQQTCTSEEEHRA